MAAIYIYLALTFSSSSSAILSIVSTDADTCCIDASCSPALTVIEEIRKEPGLHGKV